MKEKHNRSRILALRLTPKEYALLQARCKSTTCRKMSEFVRRILLNKPLTVYRRNQSLDDFMTEMIRLRGELNSLANNFNQAVKKLHTLEHIPEFRHWIIGHELQKEVLLNKVEEIKNRIAKIADQWLQ